MLDTATETFPGEAGGAVQVMEEAVRGKAGTSAPRDLIWGAGFKDEGLRFRV